MIKQAKNKKVGKMQKALEAKAAKRAAKLKREKILANRYDVLHK